MKGLELSYQYYLEIGRPMLREKFPEYSGRIAAGLAGEGSECLGFDDEISRDHDFGPGFCIWLTESDNERTGRQMQAAYEELPGYFGGFPPRKFTPHGRGRTGVTEISEFYARFIGREQPPGSLRRWLHLPEAGLAAAVSGRVFEDPLGEFTAIRTRLKEYYPEDVRIKKIAACAARMTQTGQYNYGRCMQRRDVVAAGIALSEFIRNAMAMIYLLNRVYAPYYKWMFRGLRELSVLQEARPWLVELSAAAGQEDRWGRDALTEHSPYIDLRDEKVVLIEKICRMVVNEWNRQGLSSRTDAFLELHLEGILSRVESPELRNLHVLEG